MYVKEIVSHLKIWFIERPTQCIPLTDGAIWKSKCWHSDICLMSAIISCGCLDVGGRKLV